MVSLLQYHAAAKYLPIGSLKTTKDAISSLAANGAGKFDYTVTTAGDSVTLHTGVDSSRIADTVLDSTPLAIYSVDSVLLPSELFATSPSPAPEPAGAPSPTPASAPSPADAPTPLPASPPAPAPAGESPDGAPADAPSTAAEKSSGKSAGVNVKASGVFTVAVTALSAFVVSFVFMS